MGEDGAGDALHVLCARDQDRAMMLKGGRITIRGFGSEEVVYGQRVDLAAIGAAVFDFGDSHGLVAAVGEPNAFNILVKDEGQSIRKAVSQFTYHRPKKSKQPCPITCVCYSLTLNYRVAKGIWLSPRHSKHKTPD